MSHLFPNFESGQIPAGEDPLCGKEGTGRPKSFRRRAMRNFIQGMIPTGRDVSKVIAFPLPRRGVIKSG